MTFVLISNYQYNNLSFARWSLNETSAERENILILDTYIDRAMTGTNDNRADFQRMIKDSSKREWDYVIVY